ncbi:MAG TPA: hypothetical protein VEH86_06715, partial [Candidatus Acidoferrum sp.]|nr:hypothetical protein [Candidatus Acidoferrum sp.]
IRNQIHSNHLGSEGWDLVSVQDERLADGRVFAMACLKRQTNAHEPPIDSHRPASHESRKT